MPYEPIPYAPDEVYSSRDYTRQQMALLQQQADREGAYAQRRGALMADRWKGLGGLATETLASLVQSRDLRYAKAEAQRRYDAEQAEEKRRYDLVERRAAAQEAQQALDRNKADDRFAYAQIMDLPPNTPLSPSQLDILRRVNPGAMAPLTRERDQFVARDAPPATSTEDMFADTLRQGLTGEKRGPAAPLFGGGLGTERVTEQYGVGRRRTAAEEEQVAAGTLAASRRKEDLARQDRQDTLAASRRQEDLARQARQDAIEATASAQAQKNFDITNARITAAQGQARKEQGQALPSGVQSYIASLASGGIRNGVLYTARRYDEAKAEILRAWPNLSATHKGIDLPTVLATLDKLYGLTVDPATGDRTRWSAVGIGDEQ